MNGVSDTWMILDRLRAVEGHLVDLKDRHVRHEMAMIEHDRSLQQAASSITAISIDVSQTSSLVADSNRQISDITMWSRRMALAAGLIALSFQHMTVAQMAKLIRTVLGI